LFRNQTKSVTFLSYSTVRRLADVEIPTDLSPQIDVSIARTPLTQRLLMLINDKRVSLHYAEQSILADIKLLRFSTKMSEKKNCNLCV